MRGQDPAGCVSLLELTARAVVATLNAREAHVHHSTGWGTQALALSNTEPLVTPGFSTNHVKMNLNVNPSSPAAPAAFLVLLSHVRRVGI